MENLGNEKTPRQISTGTQGLRGWRFFSRGFASNSEAHAHASLGHYLVKAVDGW